MKTTILSRPAFTEVQDLIKDPAIIKMAGDIAESIQRNPEWVASGWLSEPDFIERAKAQYERVSGKETKYLLSASLAIAEVSGANEITKTTIAQRTEKSN